MNYEKIILELMGRIQDLEGSVKSLDQRLLLVEEENVLNTDLETDGQGKFTRSQAREVTIEKIQEIFPDYFPSKASRNEGSGIKLSKPDSPRPLIIKFNHSRGYPLEPGLSDQSGDYERGWHIVRVSEVVGSIYDLCLFSMYDSDGNWNYFLFSPDELGIYNEENRQNHGDELWLYFSVQGNHAYELREGKIDVTNHLNNWKLIESYMITVGDTSKKEPEESVVNELENKFHNDMVNIYQSAKKLKYNAGYFWQMVCEKGGLQTAKHLIHTEQPSEGFSKLWELKRLDLSVEAHVIKPEYNELFTDAERQICLARLEEYGYTP
ncbi:MAG: hypothetical protein FWG36_01145 [Oscillospiraceae bacterium]|nr:hypothetical protein [Oscillospiraceae bacterium]